MTLGSIYYDKEIRKIEARESKTEIGNQAVMFLKTEHPELWRNWVSIRNMTNMHLEYIEKLWKDHILAPVSEILSKLEQQYHLIKYRNIRDKEFYVEENIIEGVFLEIQHFASLGYRLDLFKTEKEDGEVGNGFTFLRSSNKKLIEQFINDINKVIINETVLDKFKLAEVKKSEVEVRVYEFKKAIHKIYIKYFEGKKKMMNN